MPKVISDRTVRRKDQQVARRRDGQKNQTPHCASGPVAPDFLKQRFLSISFSERKVNNSWENTEHDFFSSVKHLCALYKIPVPDMTGLPFPMNIAAAYRVLKEKMESIAPSLYLIIAENNLKTTMATVKSIAMPHDLYFVPLSALDELHRAKNKPGFELLLSIFGYLNKQVRLPLLCENDYLSGCYEAINEWTTNAENELEESEYIYNCAELKAMNKKIDILERAVLDPLHLASFRKRLRSFKSKSDWDSKLKTVAQKFYALWQEFPKANFYQNISRDHLTEDEGERAYPDHYFSFFWDDHSWIQEHLMEYVNCDLQEMMEWELPVSFQYFNHRQADPLHALPFETNLLNLISELCAVLYSL